MRVSKRVRLGLSGTSLALATLASVGCTSESASATKEELRPQAYRMEQAVGTILEQQAREDAQRSTDRAVSLNNEQPVDASSPWFLKPAGAVDGSREVAARPVADVPETQQPPAIVVGQPGKPKPPVTQPVQPQRPRGWEIRAACGRG
jgi:hypothetical protein